MRLKNQRASPFLAGTMDADHDRRRRMDVAELAAAAWRSIASRSIANRSIAKPRERKVRNTKSWIACSAPRIEGKRTSSLGMGDLLGEAGLDRSDDRIARIGIP